MKTSILDGLVVGRVEPHIYAFSTQTVPDYLKVGDTYRPVGQRLDEWRRYFPNLEKRYDAIAKVDDKTYFRDLAVHLYLERERHLRRLLPDSIADLPYYSKEFFGKATAEDVNLAIADIRSAYFSHLDKYKLYSFAGSRIPLTYSYERTETFPLRPNQDETVKRFRKAIDAGRTNLLMYAVMRFGKSFTAMCCALEMNARLVVIVSAKADVREEWKKTIESHIRFKRYAFMDSTSLLAEDHALSDRLKTNDVVVFLTLQDLMGDEIKAKHREIFAGSIDLLIVDESHYGARAEEYGKVLGNITKMQRAKEMSGTDTSDDFEQNATLKALDTRVRLHLSGTPYRILMGSEFSPQDIVAFYQFTDIVRDQEAWDRKYLIDDVYPEDEGPHRKGEPVKEWDNPYYGFPQMLRFAFNPNESSLRKMEELKNNGITYAFSELFRPQSISRDDSPAKRHRLFVHEQEIMDLLEVIDGTKEDANVLGFLDLDQIKKGKMCRHIVCVLPFRASCDALESLLAIKRGSFKNLGQYDIINIAGLDSDRKYTGTQEVKDAIAEFEEQDRKTMTLKVNRMLTGSTVEQWDTMIYLKDTASPQEYDQATFRLQNQYICKYSDGKGDTIKYNMKPQTLLVDFDPGRMFRLQEQKSQIYNVNNDRNGNSKLEDRIREELRISPIIRVNKDKLQEVQPADILDAVRRYSSEKSVLDEASDIPTDYALFDNETIRAAIDPLSPIDARKGIELKPSEGKGDDLETPSAEGGQPSDSPKQTRESKTEENSLDKKLATYYALILFYAFLTDSAVISLEDIIRTMGEGEDNLRIARHVGLRADILTIIQDKSNPFILSSLDYKIQNLNSLMRDESLTPDERVETAMKKFGRLSFSEIVTPQRIAREMVDMLPESCLDGNCRILDIASKQGEFTRALYAKFSDRVNNSIYAIPTSGLTYEFTRKVYSLLGMPVGNVFDDFTTYDLLDKDKKDKIIKKLKDMNFNAVIGNPPYQLEGNNNGRKPPIYHHFMDAAYNFAKVSILITPARFLFNGGQTDKNWNEKMVTDTHIRVLRYESDASQTFSSAEIKGGVAITEYDYDSSFGGIGVFTSHIELNSILLKVTSISDDRRQYMDSIVAPQGLYRFSDKVLEEHPNVQQLSGKGTGNKIVSKIIPLIPDIFVSNPPKGGDYVKMLSYSKGGRIYNYIRRNYLQTNQYLDTFNVLIPESNGKGAFEVFSTPAIAKPGEGAADTFLSIGTFNDIECANNLLKYIRTKFARVMLGVKKVTQHNPKATWEFVPLQDFTTGSDIDWSKPVQDIDRQLYAKYGLSDSEILFIEGMVKIM